jgi:hypothetical protein
MVVEQFALKFGTPEKAKSFYDAFEDAKKINDAAMGSTEIEGAAAEAKSPKKSEE